MARWPFVKARSKQSRAMIRPRGLRFEPLEDRRLLNAGGGATKNGWPSGIPPVVSTWFQTSASSAQTHVASSQAVAAPSATARRRKPVFARHTFARHGIAPRKPINGWCN